MIVRDIKAGFEKRLSKRRTYDVFAEVTLKGFDGSTDATDDHIIVVSVDQYNLRQLQEYLYNNRDVQSVVRLDTLMHRPEADFRLPNELAAFEKRVDQILRPPKEAVKEAVETIAHVICCNDTVMHVVIGPLSKAEECMDGLIVDDYQRNQHAYKDAMEYLIRLYWHIHSVKADIYPDCVKGKS